MQQRTLKSVSRDLRAHLRWRLTPGVVRAVAAVGAVAVVVVAAISCTTVHRAVVVVPDVPGATYIGSAECEMCHDVLYRDFATADHARLIAEGPNAVNVGCESCHGPGSLHAESGGEIKPPFMFASGRPQPGMASAFPAVPTARSEEGMCYSCHLDVRGQFQVGSHHPVPEGKLACWDCHSPHKGSVHKGGGTALLSENEACLKCHPTQRGPHVFEHEAMREGCTACHSPHGSVNAKMLKLRDPMLCLQCHQQRVQGGSILIGGSDHTLRVQQGGCWTAGCHEAVHGSRVSPSLRF